MVWVGHGEQIHVAVKEVMHVLGRVAETRHQFKPDPEYTVCKNKLLYKTLSLWNLLGEKILQFILFKWRFPKIFSLCWSPGYWEPTVKRSMWKGIALTSTCSAEWNFEWGKQNQKRKILTDYLKKKFSCRKAVFRLCKSSEDKGHSSEPVFDLGRCNHNDNKQNGVLRYSMS